MQNMQFLAFIDLSLSISWYIQTKKFQKIMEFKILFFWILGSFVCLCCLSAVAPLLTNKTGYKSICTNFTVNQNVYFSNKWFCFIIVCCQHEERAFLRVNMSSGHSWLMSASSSMFSLSEAVPSSEPTAGDDERLMLQEPSPRPKVLRLKVQGRISCITEWWTIKDPRVGKVLAEPWKTNANVNNRGRNLGCCFNGQVA